MIPSVAGALFAQAASAARNETRGATHGATLEFAVLGSSSSGNGAVLRVITPDASRQILIDGGLSPRATRGALAALGLALEDTNEILFTHFDHDHAQAGWARVAMMSGLQLRCSHRHLNAALARGYPLGAIETFDPRSTGFDLGPVRVIPCENAHDDGGTVAFRFESIAGTLGFATDLGRAHEGLINLLRGVHLLAIESNYDRAMQLASNRPTFLKDRIMGGRGHLSNDECIEVVRALMWPDSPEQVVLLHLSRECNCPHLVRQLWISDLPTLAPKLTIALARQSVGPWRITAENRRF